MQRKFKITTLEDAKTAWDEGILSPFEIQKASNAHEKGEPFEIIVSEKPPDYTEVKHGNPPEREYKTEYRSLNNTPLRGSELRDDSSGSETAMKQNDGIFNRVLSTLMRLFR